MFKPLYTVCTAFIKKPNKPTKQKTNRQTKTSKQTKKPDKKKPNKTTNPKRPKTNQIKTPHNCYIGIHKIFVWNNRCFLALPTILFVVEKHICVGCPIHIAGYHEKLYNLWVTCKMLQPSLCKEIICVVPTVMTLTVFFKCAFKEIGGGEEGRRRQYFKIRKCKENNDDEQLLQWRFVWCKTVVPCYWDKKISAGKNVCGKCMKVLH